LQVLTPRLDWAAFIQGIAAAPCRILLLDYDGTLAPFQVRPELAVPYPEVLVALQEIIRAGGTRIVIVSGRSAGEIPPLLRLDPRPEIWGSHGWERLFPDGRHSVHEVSSGARQALEEAAHAAKGALLEGARLEKKLASIALHWRGLGDAQVRVVREQTVSVWQEIAATNDVETLDFDGGIELRAIGCNKQYAVKAVLAEAPGTAAVAYLGDDVTDEDAFRAITPRGVAILVRPEFRNTAADVWIQPPHELASFLRHWCVQPQEAAA
jgi:trehalose 6-phosphate phosphatase